MVDNGWSRGYVNKSIGRIRRCFKWAVENELVRPDTYHGLMAVSGLRKGRSAAREPDRVQPVDDATVQATLPHLQPVVADMIRLQRITGCRPQDVCNLRPCNIDMSADVWLYRPDTHKTEHHERVRDIPIGPKGQDILRPYRSLPTGDDSEPAATSVESIPYGLRFDVAELRASVAILIRRMRSLWRLRLLDGKEVAEQVEIRSGRRWGEQVGQTLVAERPTVAFGPLSGGINKRMMGSQSS